MVVLAYIFFFAVLFCLLFTTRCSTKLFLSRIQLKRATLWGIEAMKHHGRSAAPGPRFLRWSQCHCRVEDFFTCLCGFPKSSLVSSYILKTWQSNGGMVSLNWESQSRSVCTEPCNVMVDHPATLCSLLTHSKTSYCVD